jgi:2-keto-4-pentenoate hydratase/2-oxohepta-3-ene-1,7-dioic acid hydratase in catechol pathway
VKIAVFGPDHRVGVVDGEDLIDVEGAYAKLVQETQGQLVSYAVAAATTPADLDTFIRLGDRALDGTRHAVEYLRRRAGDLLGPRGETLVFPLDGVKLHAPLAHPAVKLGMAAANYPDHLLPGMRRQDPNITLEQVAERCRARGIGAFWKLSGFCVGNDDDVVHPAKTKYFDFEGEVAIVFGRDVRDGTAKDLDDCIWGYTLINDWSARDQGDNVLGALSLSLMKNFDTAGSVGPFIVVGEIDDPQDIPFETTVNGELRQKGNTRDMIFSFAEYVEFITRDITFGPGDMLAAGTCAGTAADATPRPETGGELSDTLFLHPGDVVEVCSPLIGTLRNRVVARSNTSGVEAARRA